MQDGKSGVLQVGQLVLKHILNDVAGLNEVVVSLVQISREIRLWVCILMKSCLLMIWVYRLCGGRIGLYL